MSKAVIPPKVIAEVRGVVAAFCEQMSDYLLLCRVGSGGFSASNFREASIAERSLISKAAFGVFDNLPPECSPRTVTTMMLLGAVEHAAAKLRESLEASKAQDALPKLSPTKVPVASNGSPA